MPGVASRLSLAESIGRAPAPVKVHKGLTNSLRNSPENARLAFEHVVNNRAQAMVGANFKFYKQINDDAFAQFFLGWLFDRYVRQSPPSGG